MGKKEKAAERTLSVYVYESHASGDGSRGSSEYAVSDATVEEVTEMFLDFLKRHGTGVNDYDTFTCRFRPGE